MLRKIFVFCTMALCLCGKGISQKTLQQYDPDKAYRQALELFEKEKYAAARDAFGHVLDVARDRRDFVFTNSQYYVALCAIELNQNDAEALLNHFIRDNPDNPKTPAASFRLGRYLYNNKKYKQAIARFEVVSPRQLDGDLANEYYFLLGYSLFMEHDNIKARAAFYQIKDGESKYAAPALYYYSHINYMDKNYQTALEGFLKLKDDATFGTLVPFYIAQIYYMQEKYEQVIEYAPNVMDEVNAKRKDEMMHIVGESFYRIELYKEAIPYLEHYITSKNPTADDNYQLAYAYYHSGEYAKAIRYFEKASNSPSALGQNALCLLGDCYIRIGDKHKARLAFASAAQMNFDPTAQENAHFNFAVLSYELLMSPFNESIKSFNEFILKYPNSERIDEAYNYLVSAYTTTRNYRLALESIEKIKNRDNSVNRAYQRVAFFRGLELFNDLNFDEAVSLFDNSLDYSRFDPLLAARCHYWKAEAYYRKGRFKEAYDEYRTFMNLPSAKKAEEFKLGYYGLGYASFSQKNYPEALTWFEKYVKAAGNASSKTVADAYNRLGDCYFMKPQLWVAIDNYDKAIGIGLSTPAYAYFQKGLCYGLLDRHERKIETLTELMLQYPNSSYTPDAIYEMGRSYITLNKQDQAINAFNKIIRDYPNSSYVSKSLVKLGLVYYNMNKGEEALKYYKQVIAKYKSSPDAREALTGIRTIYVEMNDVDGYVAYTNSLGGSFANVSLSEQDSLTYRAAENVYMTGDCDKASAGLQQYLDRFPDGSFKVNATFYLANCNQRLGKTDEAMKGFEYVIAQPRNMFTEDALMSASAIYYNATKYDDALKSYQRLATEAEIASNILDANIGVMRCLFRLNRFAEAIEAANKVLADKDLPEENVREATFVLARSYQETKDLNKAMELYRKVAVEVSSQEGAEAKYRIIEILVQQAKYKDVEDQVFDFVAKNTPHQYFMAKSFILLSDAYAAQKDDFQAVHTLQSVIDNYDKKDDGVIALAEAKKAAIEAAADSIKRPGTEEIELELKQNTSEK